LELTSGRQKRDWVYAEDVAEALWQAATTDLPPGAIINIGGGRSVSVRDTVELLLDVLGADPGLAVFGARPDRSDEILDNEADIGKAGELLQWRPQTALAEGLARTAAWIKQHPETAAQLR
jgi:nucleoside-diphosphate-sugar epimerase